MIIGFDASRSFVAQRTGTENYSYNLLTYLLQIDKKNVYKIYLRLPPEVVRTKEAIRIWLAQVTDSLPKQQNFRLVLIREKRLWTQWGLAKEIWQRPPDVLFIPAHTLPYIRKKRIKTVVTIHDLGYEYLPQYHQFPHRLWLNRSTEYAVKHADRLIAVSEATREDLVRKLGADEKKISVVYEGLGLRIDSNAISPGQVDQARTKYSVFSPYIVFVGTIQPRKNLIRLIQAFANLIQEPQISEMYPQLTLLFIGRKGWMNTGIYAEPERLGISDRVIFLGHVPDQETAAFLKGSLCFAFPTLFEGFGIPILEAQSYGAPVVTSAKKPMTEVGGTAAEYVEPLSVESIGAGLRKVLVDRKYAETLRQKGYKNITRFSWEKAARETLRVLES